MYKKVKVKVINKRNYEMKYNIGKSKDIALRTNK